MLVKIVEKSQIWTNLSKNLDFGHNCRKFSILVKIFKNVNFDQNLQKSRIWSQFSKNLDFGHNCRKLSILVKITEMSILVKMKKMIIV